MRDAHDVDARERPASDERTGDAFPRGRRAAFWAVLLGAAVLALTALAIWRRWSLLADTPYPVGIDGYFYPIQLRALLERGELAYPDYPLAFYMLAPFAALTDPIVGVKLGSAVLGGLAVVPAFFVGARLSGSRAAGLVAGAFVAVSAGGAFLAMEFVKNGIGVTVALAAIWLVLRALDRMPSNGTQFRWGRVVVALLGIAAAGLTHKLGLALVTVIAIPATLAALADRGVLRGRRLIYATVALAVVVLAALAIAGGIGHAMGAFSPNALWSSPALVTGERVVLTMGYEATWAASVAVAVGAVTAFRWPLAIPRAARATTWALVVLAAVIALPWLAVEDPQGVGFRLRVIAFVPLALLAAVATAGLAGLVRRARELRRKRNTALIANIATVLAAVTAVSVGVGLRSPVALILGLVLAAGLARAARTSTSLAVIAALAIVVVAPARRDEGRVIPHPAMVASVSALAGNVPTDDTVIIPERHIMFMAVWYARVHAQLQPQGVAPAHRWRAVTLSFIRAGSHLDDELMAARRPDMLPAGHPPPIGLHPTHPNGFVLVRDDTWQVVVSRLPEPERTRVAAWPTI